LINRRTLIFVASELLIGAVAGTVGLVAARSAAGDAATAEQVRAAFTQAVRVEQGVQVPPVAQAGDPPTAADLDRQLAEGTASIHAAFADGPAAPVIAGLNNAVESQRTGGDRLRILGAGIGEITFSDVTVRGRTARVHALVETWTRTRFRQTATADWMVSEPHNILDVSAELTQDQPGHWIVSAYQWTFTPGGGP
jgi:hypothetical protein